LNALASSPVEFSHPLAEAAAKALQSADQSNVSLADRQVRQPDTWLLRRCMLALSEHGTADAAFTAVDLLRDREPLALYRALPILARRAADDVGLAFLVSNRLQSLRFLLHRPFEADRTAWGEQILALACTAAYLEDDTLAFSLLERLDQAPGIWTTLFNQPDRRELLAETLGLVGLHPLTTYLIRHAIRRFDEAGAHFLQRVAIEAASWIECGHHVRRSRRLLQRCVETIQTATLTSLLSRRYAAAVMALSGNIYAILEQVTTIANIQDARRESGVAYREAEGKVLRQVKRPRANADVDFQFYTLKDSVDRLKPAALDPNGQAAITERLATLGVSSDGWTAAAATATLLHLGEVDHAIAVVDRIDKRDPTRSEAYRVLVEGLLARGDNESAAIQTQKAIRWAQSLPEHHPERLTIWGIAAAYLDHHQAQQALAVLAQRRPPDLRTRLRRFFGEISNEEHLREEALRMHAALLSGEGGHDRAVPILATIRRQAPQALDGKALALFYTDHVLTPLLETGNHTLAWSFLHDVQTVLGRILSREQPARVEAVATLLIHELERIAQGDGREDAVSGARLENAQAALQDLLIYLWESSAKQGIWSTVYSVGGALALVIALAGSETVLEIARFTADEGRNWREQMVVPNPEDEADEIERVR
jgi:tetratricopeptide (TPR) repeat protein